MTDPYADPDLSTERRVADLLDRMTPAEKAGQLVGAAPFLEGVGTTDKLFDLVEEYGLGAVAPFGWPLAAETDPATCLELANDLQRTAVEETRLGIPLLLYVDADHGHAFVDDTTVLPHNLGLAATRDPELVQNAAAVTAREVAATGANQALNPVCGVGREPRWGRVYETFGESPTLCAEMAAAKVRGYQGEDASADDRVAATAKHFPAYSDPVRGEDAAPVEISEHTLQRVFVPSFQAAIDAGALSVMPAYNELDGHPVHGSRRHLTDLLRGELDFDGVTVSDWHGVKMLHEDHRTARSMDEATYQATTAGLDITSIGGPAHVERLRDLLASGRLDEETVDAAARRVLRVKFDVGLFEDPYTDPAGLDGLRSRANRETALRCARESMTLLQNDDDVLPLADDADVLVAGPNADSLRNQFGGWSNVDDETSGISILEGLEERAGGAVVHEPGADLDAPVDLDSAVNAAADADAAVVVVGEPAYLHEFENSGSPAGAFPSRHSLELPDAQRDLVAAVAGTGTPTVVVLVSGRPLAIEQTADSADALLWAYLPGSEAGQAVAETLFGDHNPAGTLPISIPRSTGHLPTRFNHRPHPTPIGSHAHPPAYDPLFPFGHGLSYTDFDVSGPSLSVDSVGPEGAVTVTVEVSNVGDRDGETAIHLYGTDRFSSRVTPVRELVAFERVAVPAGETREVSFEVDVGAFAVVGDDGTARTEPGVVELSCGGETVELVVEGYGFEEGATN